VSDRDKTGVIDIGRKSLGCAGVAILDTGVMVAVFRWRGIYSLIRGESQ